MSFMSSLKKFFAPEPVDPVRYELLRIATARFDDVYLGPEGMYREIEITPGSTQIGLGLRGPWDDLVNFLDQRGVPCRSYHSV